jgi:integrase
MASLMKLKTGAYRLTITRGEKQIQIGLGKMTGKAPAKTAERILSEVDTILSCNAGGQSYPPETSTWLASISDELHRKLVKAGLINDRQRRTLGQVFKEYAAERTDWKERTRLAFNTSTKMILEFFGEETPLERITVDSAVAFRLELQKTYAEASISKIIKHCRQVFNLALRRKLITDSPFETVKLGCQSNPDRLHFVSMDEYRKLLEGCTNPKQRLILTLARIGGLRCPSELCGLRWSEINYSEKWFWVHSPKTEHHVGKDKRRVPLFPLIETALTAVWDTLNLFGNRKIGKLHKFDKIKRRLLQGFI